MPRLTGLIKRDLSHCDMTPSMSAGAFMMWSHAGLELHSELFLGDIRFRYVFKDKSQSFHIGITYVKVNILNLIILFELTFIEWHIYGVWWLNWGHQYFHFLQHYFTSVYKASSYYFSTYFEICHKWIKTLLIDHSRCYKTYTQMPQVKGTTWYWHLQTTMTFICLFFYLLH